jgi:ribose transport system substrate-binding protein
MKKLFSLIMIVALLAVFVPVVNAAPPAQGQEYIIAKGDWLSKLAEKYLGNVMAYPAIVDATNKKHAEDSTFVEITNPDLIEPGWKIWVPSAEEAAAFMGAPTIKVAVIGKSVHPYWANVEKGVQDAGAKLGVQADFFVPTKEDVALQVSTMEGYIAQGYDGIAVAPSDPKAMEATIKAAMDAGIPVITLDTDAPESVRLAYVGTSNKAAGVVAGQEMAKLLPDGGQVAFGTGSLTALNSLERMEGFREGMGDKITVIEPVNNDKEDSATALELANATLVANPDLVGAFGVYAYNGPAWAKALKEQGKVGEVKIVCFDATDEHIEFLQEGVIDVLVAQREYFQGYKSVELLTLMAQKGIEAGMAEYGVPDDKIVDTGVDVVTLAGLADYDATLTSLGIPHTWTAGPAAAAIKVAVIGKSVHPYWANVEKGVQDAGAKLGVQADFFVPTKEDVALQVSTMEGYIAQGYDGIAVAPSDPKAMEATIKAAMDAGIPVITLDTDAPESVRLAYVGTSNKAAGVVAGQEMAKLLPDGGQVAFGTGSLTALNSLERMEGFREGMGDKITVIEPVNNDKEDSATALELANATLVANPDLVGAFGVYAYNGPAWAKALKEQGKVGEVKIVCFDATDEHIEFLQEGVIDVLVAQREYFQGYKSVELLTLMAQKGIEAGMAEYGVPDDKIVDTGVDVVTLAGLADYDATLTSLGIPHTWTP